MSQIAKTIEILLRRYEFYNEAVERSLENGTEHYRDFVDKRDILSREIRTLRKSAKILSKYKNQIL